MVLLLGTPSSNQWPEGYKLAAQIGFKFPQCNSVPLRSLVPTASDLAIDLMYSNILIKKCWNMIPLED